jgi:hypothetical protein
VSLSAPRGLGSPQDPGLPVTIHAVVTGRRGPVAAVPPR